MQAGAGLFHELVAELDDLREVVPGVHVEEFEGDGRRGEGAAGQFEDHHGVLATGKQQPDLVELPGDLAQDVDGFGL